MIRIDTIEDLVRVLDDHPDWLEAVRTRLLSREVLELPSQVADLVAGTKAFRAETKTEIAELKTEIAELKTEIAELKTDVAELRTDMNRQFKSIRDDLGVLKGAHARNVAERNLGLIARSMGLRQRRVLDGGELFDLASAAGADMNDDAVRSYVQADVVFEAENAQGETEYVAVEVSYSANGRDTARAMRNAGFLTRFTGSVCRPAVSSVHVDDRIAALIESGRVAWYRMPRRALEAA